MEGPLEVLDRPAVVPFPDRPPRVAERDLGLVRMESLAFQPSIEDLGIRDPGRRLPGGVADGVDVATEADRHRARGFDEPFLEHVSRGLDFGLEAVREDALSPKSLATSVAPSASPRASCLVAS